MINEKFTGSGNVVLIAGGGRIYTDIAARFVKSERALDDIVASPYSKKIVENILRCGHKAALEFDFFVFGVEGYSRVTEVQLVRKRLASYLIKSGRPELSGKRAYSVVYPKSLSDFFATIDIPLEQVLIDNKYSFCEKFKEIGSVSIRVDVSHLNRMIEQWYDQGLENGLKEEDLRYMKPQATEFKGIIGMNAHALHDWFSIRCCLNAQHEIRDLANKMLGICKKVAPDLFMMAGPSCVQLGYCPENNAQNEKCIGRIITKNKALEVLSQYQGEK